MVGDVILDFTGNNIQFFSNGRGKSRLIFCSHKKDEGEKKIIVRFNPDSTY